jgi:regulatory protein
LGFLNDDEWTASFVRGQSNRKVGPRAIAQKLASKGVRGEKLEQALENSWNPSEQKALITSLLKSRYAKKNLSDFKERQKVIASLMRKGFDFSAIMGCLKSVSFNSCAWDMGEE